MRVRSIAPASIAVLLLAAGACTSSAPRPNILLITLDTTRADRLGCYGHTPAGTPTIDALAAAGARFENAHAQAPLTLPSHTSLLTGLYARVHSVQVNGGGRLPGDVSTLQERLGEAGYRTGAFVSSFVLDSAFGLDRGFDVYDDDLGGAAASARYESERTADRVTDAALRWLDGGQGDRPFFAWVHYFDPHSPYAPPRDYRGRFEDPYDGELAFVDDQVQRLLEALDRSGKRETTLIIVVGDHGEGFAEHGEPEHGLFVYGSTVNVPLIVHWPGQIAVTAPSADVQTIDLYPTILDLLGLPYDPAEINGASLAPLLNGEPSEPRVVYGESRYGQIGYGWAPLRYLITPEWKLIEAPRPELYARASDPGETVNVIEDHPDEGTALRLRLHKLERQLVPRRAEAIDLDSDALQKLQSLGYVGSTSPGTIDLYANRDDLPDPKDMLDVFLGHIRAGRLSMGGNIEGAIALLHDLIAKSPESYDLYKNLGFAYLSLNQNAEAQRAYEMSLKNLPEDPERLWGLAEALRRQGELDDALVLFREVVALRPGLGEAHMGLTAIHAARGQWNEAFEHASKHAEIHPGSTVALENVIQTAGASGRFVEAAAAADRLLEIRPTDAATHQLRWQAWRAAKRYPEAVQAIRESLEILPGDYRLTCGLSWLLAAVPGQPEGSVDEAIRLAETAVRAQPEHPAGHDTLAVAYAAAGRFPQAIAEAERALQLAEEAGDTKLASAITLRLQLFRNGSPFTE